MKKHTVLLIEDDDSTRNRLADVIKNHEQLELIAAVANCADARAELDERQPDVMLTDLGLPDGSGIDLIKEISQRGYSTEVSVITMFADEKHVIAAIEAGATGYILKDGSSEYVVDTILQILDGYSPISPSIARHLLKRFHGPETDPLPEAIDVPKLTNREKDVLSYLAKGFSFNEIADMLTMSPHTVTTHVKHIYKKLAVRSRSEAVFEALQLGIIKMDR